MLISDGNLSDAAGDIGSEEWPFPIYPVVEANDQNQPDIRLQKVAVSETDFETSPMTIRASIAADQFAGDSAVAQLVDADGIVIEQQTLAIQSDSEILDVRFEFKPAKPGVQFYRVRTFAESDRSTIPARFNEIAPVRSNEITWLNNERTVVAERQGGPFRVLYLAGRPNWEFKFLRRALQADLEVQLVGLIRMANKEPKFSFRDNGVSDSNPLFAGLGTDAEESSEQYDEAVMLRFGVNASEELSAGFPTTAEELFSYHGIVLDDIEPEFFSQDQMLLLRKFVSVRGGGLMMLGGQESFDSQSFAKTPLGDLSPVYPPSPNATATAAEPVRWGLTREGLLQPWQRLRQTEKSETDRLANMPEFRVVHGVRSIKPGASELATARTASGETQPAMVTQRFGKGRTAAVMVGDLWRWSIRSDGQKSDGPTNELTNSAEFNAAPESPDDPAQMWRQMIRWLVGEVPRRVELNVVPDESGGSAQLRVIVRDENYLPMDNADVKLLIESADGIEMSSADDSDAGPSAAAVEPLVITARPDETELGLYTASFSSRESGSFRVVAKVDAPDRSFIGESESGWVASPGSAEYRSLSPNRSYLTKLAEQSGGSLVNVDDMDSFVDQLSARKVPILETWVYPIWHQASVMILAIACLCGEWGLRRWRGMA